MSQLKESHDGDLSEKRQLPKNVGKPGSKSPKLKKNTENTLQDEKQKLNNNVDQINGDFDGLGSKSRHSNSLPDTSIVLASSPVDSVLKASSSGKLTLSASGISTSPSLTTKSKKGSQKRTNTERWPVIALLPEPHPKPASGQELLRILLVKRDRKFFRDFLESQNCNEGLDFWVAVESFRRRALQPDLRKSDVRKMANDIYTEFIELSSPDAVNLPHEVKARLDKAITDLSIHNDIFDEAWRVVFSYMNADPFKRFKKSDHYSAMISDQANRLPSEVAKESAPTWSFLSHDAVLFKTVAKLFTTEYSSITDLLFWASVVNFSTGQYGLLPNSVNAAIYIANKFLKSPTLQFESSQLEPILKLLSKESLTVADINPTLFDPLIVKVENVLRNKFLSHSFDIHQAYIRSLERIEALNPGKYSFKNSPSTPLKKLKATASVEKTVEGTRTGSGKFSLKKQKSNTSVEPPAAQLDLTFEDLIFNETVFHQFEVTCAANDVDQRLHFWRHAMRFACNLDLSSAERKSYAQTIIGFYIDTGVVVANIEAIGETLATSNLDPKMFDPLRIQVEASLRALWFTFVPL